jgi:hypothetical protein
MKKINSDRPHLTLTLIIKIINSNPEIIRTLEDLIVIQQLREASKLQIKLKLLRGVTELVLQIIPSIKLILIQVT